MKAIFLGVFFIVFLIPIAVFAGGRDSMSSHRTRPRHSHLYSITFCASNFSILGLTPFDPYIGPPDINDIIASQFGCGMERRITNKVSVSAFYSAWNINKRLNLLNILNDDAGTHLSNSMYVKGSPNYNEIDALRFRYGYKMIDLTCNYITDIGKRNKVIFGFGPSFTYGTNFYLYNKYFNYTDNVEVYILTEKKGQYFGLVIPFKYDFSFIRQRLSVGVQSNLRKYFSLYSCQVDYGIHLSINF